MSQKGVEVTVPIEKSIVFLAFSYFISVIKLFLSYMKALRLFFDRSFFRLFGKSEQNFQLLS